jgi:hypothetical protein
MRSLTRAALDCWRDLDLPDLVRLAWSALTCQRRAAAVTLRDEEEQQLQPEPEPLEQPRVMRRLARPRRLELTPIYCPLSADEPPPAPRPLPPLRLERRMKGKRQRTGSVCREPGCLVCDARRRRL